MNLDIRHFLVELPRAWKRLVLIGFDVVALGLAVWASVALRYDRWAPPASIEQFAIMAAAPLIAVPVFIHMGLYRSVLRYLPERAVWTILQSMVLASVGWVVVVFLFQMGGGAVARSVPVLYCVIGTVLIAGSRFGAKWLFWPNAGKTRERRAVAIYGAGQAGTLLANALRGTHFVAGFLDDDPALQRRDVAGIRVHPPAALPSLVRDFGVGEVILSMPAIGAARRKEIVARIGGQGVRIRSLPPIGDLVSGKYLVSQIREIDVDELLGRSAVPPDTGLIGEMIGGRSIMVTGAGGSIGSELCRLIARWHPRRLVLFEANEFALYRIERELAGISEISVVPVLGSVTDAARVERAIAKYDVKVLFHAAAYKHVPLVEANALEGIANNVMGTRTVADVAFRAGVRDFVLISTDKAVRPTNVMGATKRWAELIVREKAEMAARARTGQRFCAVRFGNVLGSNGSVVPLFKDQIANGGPLTLTDPAMSRYFMSIHEAAELIVQAGALSEGGDIFLLDMGEPVLIRDLAENMIRLAGFSVRGADDPEGDIEIVTIGRRPGEKLHEELFYDEAGAERTRHPKILRSPPSEASTERPDMAGLTAALARQDEQAARRILFDVAAEPPRMLSMPR